MIIVCIVRLSQTQPAWREKLRSWEVEKLGWAENQLHAFGFSELHNFTVHNFHILRGPLICIPFVLEHATTLSGS
jgi:hypothetical protein